METTVDVSLSTDLYEVSPVGFLGFIHYYLRKIHLAETIDSILPAHGNWGGVSLGVLSEVYLLYLMSSLRVLYRAEEWYVQTPYIRCLYPTLEKSDLTDDRLGILLDKLSSAGVSTLYNKVVLSVLSAFDLDLSRIHFDLTNFVLYGNYPPGQDDPVQVIYGYSKHKRSDLKQVKMGAAVAGDSGVVVGMETYDGNQADVSTYINFWKNLCTNLQRSDFLFIGDCKLYSEANLWEIMNGNGYFLTLAPHYANLDAKLQRFLKSKPNFEVLAETENKDKTTEVTYKGAEFSELWTDPNDKKHQCKIRHIVIWSKTLHDTQRNTLKKHLDDSTKSLDDLAGKLNQRQFKTPEAIKSKIESLLSQHKTTDFISYTLNEQTIEQQKQIGRGKPSANTKYETYYETVYSISYSIEQKKVEEKEQQMGYYMLLTNQTAEQLGLTQAFGAYKDQYKAEKTFARTNNPIIAATPMFLQKPARINAMLLMVMLATQLFSLIDHQAATKIKQTKQPLQGLLPNKNKSARPKTEQLIRVFDNIRIIKKTDTKGKVSWHMSVLNSLQIQILELLNVPIKPYYSTEILKDINDKLP